MTLFLVTFFIMMLAVAGMAVGVMFGLNPIAGSCGGLNAVDGSGACQSCSRPCKSRKKAEAQAAVAGDAQPLTRSSIQLNKQPGSTDA